MTGLILQFSSSDALTSSAIRWICRSRFSHVDIVLPGEGLLGASGPDKYATWTDPGGVQIRPFEPWPYHIKRAVTLNIPQAKADAIIARWRSQIGKPFDDDAVHAFLSFQPVMTRDWRGLDKWFCSEGVIWSCESEGLFPWKLCVPMNRVSPNDCMEFVNPFLSDADVDSLLN